MKTKINPNKIPTRDYAAMQEYIHGKGGAHRNYKKYDRKQYQPDWTPGSYSDPGRED